MLSREYCKVFRSNFFYRTPSVTASGKQELMENMVCIIGNMGGIEIPCILFLYAF